MGISATKPVSSPIQDSSPLDFINASVSAHQVVIFSKTWCGMLNNACLHVRKFRLDGQLTSASHFLLFSGYCSKTKQLFGKLEEASDVEIIELDTRPDGNEIQEALATKTGQRTVPNVFINQQHVGGCDDTFSLFNTGALAKMLLKQSKL